MVRSRKMSLIAAVAALPLALAACSSGGSDDTAGDASTEKSLTIWHYESDDSAMGQAWNKAIEIFKSEHAGVTVTVEHQTFEAIQKNAKIVLTGAKVPDVMEYNKGNATAGQLAAQGLLTDLTGAAQKYGWDERLSGSLQTTARYDENGLMGAGNWYGVPNYGEFVSVYYNKDMFAQAGVKVPVTMDEFVAVLDAFKAKGITPLAEAAAEYPMGQLWYDLVLANADRDFVDSYQLFKGDVDWHGKATRAATETLADWVKKGYLDSNSAGLKAEDMGTSFFAGKYPMMVSGSWWFGRVVTDMKADWGQFNFPGNKLQIGSSGNLWVVPENAKSKGLAQEFIDITLRPEVQDLLGEKGGLPVAGDASKITDERTKTQQENFDAILESDGLSFYPDWPVAGFYDVIVSQLQSLINGSKTPDQVLDGLQEAYESGKADIVG